MNNKRKKKKKLRLGKFGGKATQPESGGSSPDCKPDFLIISSFFYCGGPPSFWMSIHKFPGSCGDLDEAKGLTTQAPTQDGVSCSFKVVFIGVKS
jgi:hypothetical protein